MIIILSVFSYLIFAIMDFNKISCFCWGQNFKCQKTKYDKVKKSQNLEEKNCTR